MVCLLIMKVKQISIPYPSAGIADVSGAGDTVISMPRVRTFNCQPARDWHLSMGGLVCQHVGVVPVNKEELFRGR